MSQKLSQLFKNIPQKEPTPGLGAAILASIEVREVRVRRWKLVFSGLVSIGSATAVLIALVTLGQEFLHSEFMNMLSLAFSDLGVVAENWYDFGLSLMETFPTATASLILLPLFTLFLSVSSYLDLNNNHKRKYI